MRTLQLCLLMAGLIAMPACAAPTRPWTSEEIAQIDRLPLTGPKLDASRETVVVSSDDDRTASRLAARPELGSRGAQLMHWALCRAEMVALARAREALPRLNAAGTMVYSKVDFDVLDVIKRPSDGSHTDWLPVLRRGGTLVSAEQRLHVHDEPSFIEGQDYLLLLSRPEPRDPLLRASHQQLPVRAGLMKPWFHLEGSVAYASVRAEITRLLSFGCP